MGEVIGFRRRRHAELNEAQEDNPPEGGLKLQTNTHARGHFHLTQPNAFPFLAFSSHHNTQPRTWPLLHIDRARAECGRDAVHANPTTALATPMSARSLGGGARWHGPSRLGRSVLVLLYFTALIGPLESPRSQWDRSHLASHKKSTEKCHNFLITSRTRRNEFSHFSQYYTCLAVHSWQYSTEQEIP